MKLSLAALGGLGILAAALLLRDPSRTPLIPPCPFHVLTGLHCPGCGSLRAIRSMVTGDFVAALRWNTLATLTLPIAAAHLAFDAWAGLARRRGLILPSLWIWSYLAVLLAFGVLRNLEASPFHLLAPHP